VLQFGGKRFDDDEEVGTELLKLVAKRWDKCINVSGGYAEI
jgi:hypothetical protein